MSNGIAERRWCARNRRAGLIVAILLVTPVAMHAQTAQVTRTAQAFEVRHTVTFAENQLTFGQMHGYDTVRLTPPGALAEPGRPRLPAPVFELALPAGMAVTAVQVTSRQIHELLGQYVIFPTQPPQRAFSDPAEFVMPDPATYAASTAYPALDARLVRECDLAGQELAVLQVYPLHYIPAEQRLVLTTSMTIVLKGVPGYVCGDYLSANASSATQAVLATEVASMVVNPEDVTLRCMPAASRTVPPGDYDYVIVTTDEWVSAFQPLADWKTKKGVPANIVTTSWINTMYAGANEVAKIRAFVQDAYANWGTTFVLLGGDTAYVPCHWLGGPDGTPNDTYYADFDDDLVCEVNVGRASVIDTGSGPGGIGTFISKILTYEKNPPSTFYARRVGLFGFDLSWATPAEQYKTAIAADYIPLTWIKTCVYDSQSGYHPAALINAINFGQMVMNHADHCSDDTLGAGSINHGWYVTNDDMDALNNGDRQGILYSMGCDPAAYDDDACIGEHFVRNPTGGGIAFIGNSRSGYFYEGDPDSLSLLFDKYFFRSLFQENLYKLGVAFSDHKNDVMPGEPTDEYLFRELTLLGDPELPVWTGSIQSMTVTHPATVTAGAPTEFVVHVMADSMPIVAATVCLWKPADIYAIGLTSFIGNATFTITPATTGTLYVTVTKQHRLPYEGSAEVISPITYGDLNCDGSVNFGDINPFVLALADPEQWETTYPCDILNGDINQDGAVNFGDINPFVACLSSNQCP
jgi:hypothetical protein